MGLVTQPNAAAIAQSESQPVKTPSRNVAVDAYRGFVMLLMMGEVVRFASLSEAFPNNWFWSILAFNQTHVQWSGCSLHDTIQPSFSFLVGVALPYSIASRLSRGGQFRAMFGHALWRSLLLMLLGFFLRSLSSTQTNFTFEDTLTQIGLGYPILFLLGFRSSRWAWSAFAALLFSYWLAWALYPAPSPGFNWPAVGVARNWPHNFSGFASHWNKNSNLGQSFDVWFLNLFPREHPFIYNSGGYLTLSFIPTLGTMILGLICGRWFREYAPKIPVKRFVVAGLIGVAVGALLHFTGICPIVKRIWTPAWTLFSGGLCFLFMAAFSWVIDVKDHRKWAFPLVVVGSNSIAAYCMAHLFEKFIVTSFRIHFGEHFFAFLGNALEPLLLGIAVLAIYWLILNWMYRNKVFLKI